MVMWEELVAEVPKTAKKLAEKFWPGPLTIVLKKSEKVSKTVSAGLDTVGVRMPNNAAALSLIEKAEIPLAAPSANSSGSPSPTKPEHVINDLNGKIDAVIDGGSCDIGVESTVLDLSGEIPKILRPGGISKEQIESVIGKAEIDSAVLTPQLTENPASPGMKYKHYSPKAKVIIISGETEKYIKFCNEKNHEDFALCFDEAAPNIKISKMTLGSENDLKTAANRLFDTLRELDNSGAKTIYVQKPPERGIGLAVLNRVLRAANFFEIKL